MIGKVTTWQMTPEQLEEYRKKYPIRPTKKPKGVNFDTGAIDYKKYNQRKKESLRKRKEAKAAK